MSIQYVVESVGPAENLATVLFFNPYHTGQFIEEISPGVFRDNDPNPHVRKNVRIPAVEGVADREAFLSILEDQARGIEAQMEESKKSAAPQHDKASFDALVGLVSTPSED